MEIYLEQIKANDKFQGKYQICENMRWTRYRNVENETNWISSRFLQMKEKLLKIVENSQICLGFRLEQLFLRLWKQKGFIVKPKTIPWLSQFATGMWYLMNIVYDLMNDMTRKKKNILFPKFRNSKLKARISKIFEINSTNYSNSEKSEQLFKNNIFFQLLSNTLN